MAASLWGLKDFVRSSKSRGTFTLFLTDNLGNALSVEKGRAGDPRLLHLLRVWCAYLIAGNCRIRMRWLPSELNPSDADS
eukprot:12425658-Karenia_brevis.AAC.1